MESYRVQNLSRLARDGAAGWSEPNEGLDNGQKMQCQFMFLGCEFKLAPPSAPGKRAQKLKEHIERQKRVSALREQAVT